MHRILLLITALAVVLACPAHAQQKKGGSRTAAPARIVGAQPQDSAPLAALFEAYWEDQARMDPLPPLPGATTATTTRCPTTRPSRCATSMSPSPSGT